MNPESEQRRDQAIERMLRSLSASGELPQPLTEEDLWEYALGLLEPAEEHEMLTRIACSEEAREELAQIRSSMAAAASHVASVRALIEGKIARTLAAMKRKPSSLAAVILKHVDGMALAFGTRTAGGEGAVLAHGLLGGETQTSEPGSPTDEQVEEEGVVAKRLEISSSVGVVVRLVSRPKGRIDVQVSTSKTAFEGQKARFYKLVAKNAGEEEPALFREGEIHDGTATLKGCSHGLLEIVDRDGREMVIWVEPERR